MKKRKSMKTEIAEFKNTIRESGLYIIESYEEFMQAIDQSIGYYAQDPLFSYLCGGCFDQEIAKAVFIGSFMAAGNRAIAYSDGPDFNYFALWLSSRAQLRGFGKLMKYGGWKVIKYGGRQTLHRIIKYAMYAAELRKKVTGHRDWYLLSFPAPHGEESDELWRLMISPAIKYAWEQDRLCYVEASDLEMLNNARRAGFRVLESTVVPGSKIELYSMIV